MRRFRGVLFSWGLLLAGLFLSCTPNGNPSPVSGSVLEAQILSVDSGGPVGHRTMIPVLALHLTIKNPGAEVRLLGYRYETSEGIASEALMDQRLVDASRSRLGRLIQLGLPTVFSAGSTTSGWVFFKSSDQSGRLHLSLRDVYGRFSALYIPVGSVPASPKGSPGKGASSPLASSPRE